ncbi:MAG: class I SAM-dependent methyltransferase [Gemmatimonadota bacterium]
MSNQPGVSSHLGIPLAEYDSRIPTFVPFYEEMLEKLGQVVGFLAGKTPTILDLGVGTGALARRCLRVRPHAKLIGIDLDPEILDMARSRFRSQDGVELRCGNFLEMEFPKSDLIVASISLHHVSDPESKVELYERCRQALGSKGALLMADCFPHTLETLAERGRAAWRRHLEQHYSPDEASRYLAAWAEEDTHFPLAEELEWLRKAGFRPEVVWRRDLFGVLVCS